jgi:hypothetical protein
MRDRATSALVLLALVLGVPSPRAASAGENGCVTRPPSARAVLPAAITIATVCGRYRIARDGRVRLVSADSSPIPRSAAWWPGTGVWDRIEHGRLVIGRWQTQLWRSHGRFPLSYDIGAIAVGPRALAFSYGNRRLDLYFARLGGRERRIAAGEYPVGWTLGGVFTRRDAGGRLLLRGGNGAVRETVARHVYRYAYDQTDGSVYFIARGGVVRAQGRRQERLASLAALGLSSGPALQLQPTGRMLALQDTHRLVVVRPDGSVYAGTRLPARRTRVDGISSAITAAPDANAVAFTATRGNTAYGSHGSETIYVLRAGARRATPVHTERLDFAVCERGADLAWHGRMLLYGASEGRLLALDTTGARRPIRLSRLVRVLAGPSGDEGNLDYGATWAP